MDRKHLVIIILLLFISNIGFACQCYKVSIDSAFKDSSMIFKGRVKQIIEGQYFHYQGSSSTLINFEVSEGYKKAKKGGGLISIINYGTSCDLHFEKGKEYYVFAYDLGYGHYSADMCTKTSPVEYFIPQDLKRLKELATNYIDDLYNYRDLMVLNKTTYNALSNENVRLAKLVDEQRNQIRIMIFSFVVVAASLIIFFLLQKRRYVRSKPK